MSYRIRPAHSADALHIAAIVDMAGHGLDLNRWMNCRDRDHSVFSAIRRLVLEDTCLPYHYSKSYMIEVDDQVAGGLIGGLVTEKPELKDWPPYVEPVLLLENRILGDWSVVAIALYPEFRCMGFASKLLDHAVVLARQSGARGDVACRGGHEHCCNDLLPQEGLRGNSVTALDCLWRSNGSTKLGDAPPIDRW